MNRQLDKALLESLEKQNYSQAKECLLQGANPNIRYSQWNWPSILSSVGSPSLLLLFIEKGADINVCEENKFYSPLILATRVNSVDSVKILLENGANRHHQSFAGLPALFYAMEFRHRKIFDLLLKQEDNVEFLNYMIDLYEDKKEIVHLEEKYRDRIILKKNKLNDE